MGAKVACGTHTSWDTRATCVEEESVDGKRADGPIRRIICTQKKHSHFDWIPVEKDEWRTIDRTSKRSQGVTIEHAQMVQYFTISRLFGSIFHSKKVEGGTTATTATGGKNFNRWTGYPAKVMSSEEPNKHQPK